MSLQKLLEISRYYGSDPGFILAGGGNTSYKDDAYLYVKASGFSLAEIGRDGFVQLNLAALAQLWDKGYPADTAPREEAILNDLLAARVTGETNRPSVETMLHAVMPQAYIVHTHPALVNGLTCGRQGAVTARQIFGAQCLWVQASNPGYDLACLIRKQLAKHRQQTGVMPAMIFLENHGVFVGAAEVEEIKNVYSAITTALEGCLSRGPDLTPLKVDEQTVEAAVIALQNYPAFAGSRILFEANRELSRVVASRQAFAGLVNAYTPDHIVYAGPEMLFVEQTSGLAAEIDSYLRRWHCLPRIIALQHTGVFVLGESDKIAATARLLFLDALKIAVYAESFGGPKFMEQDKVEFILNWEGERFRKQVSFGKG